VLAFLWMMASLLFYALWRRRDSAPLLSLSLLSFLLALLSKETAAVLPFLVAAVELLYFSARINRRYRFSFLSHFAILILYLLLRRQVLGAGEQAGEPFPLAVSAVALPFTLVTHALGKLVLPLSLSAEYDGPLPRNALSGYAILGLVVTLALAYSAWRWRKARLYGLGVAVLLIGFVPILRSRPSWDMGAERFLYLPSLGLAMVLTHLLLAMARRPVAVRAEGESSPAMAQTMLVVLFLVVAFYSTQTISRNRDWANEQILARKTAVSAPSIPEPICGWPISS